MCGRAPRAKELAVLLALYRQTLEKYRKETVAARQLTASVAGAPPRELDTAELAAWTVVANVLLNLDETITKE